MPRIHALGRRKRAEDARALLGMHSPGRRALLGTRSSTCASSILVQLIVPFLNIYKSIVRKDFFYSFRVKKRSKFNKLEDRLNLVLWISPFQVPSS